MPYRFRPRWAYLTVHTLRVVAYLGVVVAGISSIILTPNVLSNYDIAFYLSQAWGGIVSVSSLVSIYGVVAKRYRFELTAAPFLLTGLFLFAATIIWTSALYFPTMVVYAAIVFSLAVVVLLRFIELLGHASNLRAEHDHQFYA